MASLYSVLLYFGAGPTVTIILAHKEKKTVFLTEEINFVDLISSLPNLGCVLQLSIKFFFHSVFLVLTNTDHDLNRNAPARVR